MKKAMEKIAEFRLSENEYDEIPDDQRAAISVVSYAVGEITALMRMYLFSQQSLTDDPVVDGAIFIQTNVLLRTLSAKIFEVSELVNTKDKKNKTDDEVVLRIFNDAFSTFEELRSRKGYQIARAVRHEAANHYRLKPAKQNTASLGKGARLSFCMHKKQGNSFNPIGEECIFIARINREGADFGSKEEKIALHQEWFRWNLDAVDWVNSLFERLFSEVVLQRFPNKKASWKVHWMDPRLVGEVGEVQMPVFLRANSWAKETKK